MNCCTECFSSPNIKQIISDEGSRGKCEFCENDDALILDATQLNSVFQPLFEVYSVADNGETCVNRFAHDFPTLIFASHHEGRNLALLRAIFENDLDAYADFLEKPLSPRFLTDPIYIEKRENLQLTWGKFVGEIKAVNRFHIQNVIELEVLDRLLISLGSAFPVDTILFRGRLSTKEGFGCGEMGPPPVAIKSGRANPTGISYLYLANDIRTTLFETRAAQHDYVTISEFRAVSEINIVDLRRVGTRDPFELIKLETLEDYLAYLPFLENLRDEISRPVRRNDSELDYLPTQYITERIKFNRFDGVGYGSSLDENGHNVAIFDSGKFVCMNAQVYEITNINFEHELVQKDHASS